MGNNTATLDNQQGSTTISGRGKFKIQTYPTNVPEDEWRTSDFWSTILSVNGDQRVRAQSHDYKINNNHKQQILIQSYSENKNEIKEQTEGANICDTSPKGNDDIIESDSIAAEDNKENDHDEKNTDHNKPSIYNIVRLKMKHSETCHEVGSGVIIYHTLNKAYILTAAHNIVATDEHNINKLEYPESVWMELNQNTQYGFNTIKRYNCSNYYVHPSYIKYLQLPTVKETATGYDVAVIEVLDPNNELKNIIPLKLRLYQSPIKNMMKIRVIGFPGDKELTGQLYGMKGVGNIKYVADNIKYNKLIVYDDIDTSGGQSGAPIFELDCERHNIDTTENKEDNIDINAPKEDEKYEDNIFKSLHLSRIVGIHSVGAKKKKLNYGTMLNDGILQWVHKCIDGDCIKYDTDKCDVGVLLITSSKSKFESRLNDIYKKCVKTEIMETRRLYYEKGEFNLKDVVRKTDFLFYIEEMFKKQKQRYVIFYCGESDEFGNWIINNNSPDNITLNDISQCGNIHKESIVYIVSDCSQSGNWVNAFLKNKNKFQHIDGIQASSKENESCYPGQFTSKYAQCGFCWKAKMNVAQNVTASTVGWVGALTVGTVFDGAIKQPFHKATKKSQPTASFTEGVAVGCSRDGIYDVFLMSYGSWYNMDFVMTTVKSESVGSGGYKGFY